MSSVKEKWGHTDTGEEGALAQEGRGESGAVEGYTPATRVCSQPPLPPLGSSSKGSGQKGVRKEGEMVGSREGGVGDMGGEWGRAGRSHGALCKCRGKGMGMPPQKGRASTA